MQLNWSKFCHWTSISLSDLTAEKIGLTQLSTHSLQTIHRLEVKTRVIAFDFQMAQMQRFWEIQNNMGEDFGLFFSILVLKFVESKWLMDKTPFLIIGVLLKVYSNKGRSQLEKTREFCRNTQIDFCMQNMYSRRRWSDQFEH